MSTHEGYTFGKPPPAPSARRSRGLVPPAPPREAPSLPEAEPTPAPAAPPREKTEKTREPEPPRAAPPPAAPREEVVWRREHILILAGITFIAGLLRLYRIDEWSLWIDEGHTYRDVLRPWEEFWQTKNAGYPLSYLLLRGVMPILPGTGEGSLRLAFAFFGIASVPLLAFMVRPMLGYAPALLGSAMLALSPWHIYWSQNCRFYALVLFFGLAAAGLFYVGVERGNLVFCFMSLAFGALAALSHPSAALIFPAFAIYLLAIRWLPNPPKGYTRGLVVPLLVLMAAGTVVAWLLFTPVFSDWQKHKAEFSLPHLLQTSAYYIRVPVIVTALAGGVWLVHAKSRAGVFLVLLLVVPFLELVFISTRAKATAQYLFYTLPAFCALAGVCAHVITQRLQASGFGAHLVRFLPLAIILLDMASYDYLYYFHMHGDRPRWREASQLVRAKLGDKDVVLTVNGPSVEYYLNPAAKRLQAGRLERAVELTPWDLHGDNENRVEQLRQYVDEGHQGTVWIMLTEPEFDEMDRRGRQWSQYIRDHWHLVKSFRNWSGPKDMTVHVYRRLPDAR